MMTGKMIYTYMIFIPIDGTSFFSKVICLFQDQGPKVWLLETCSTFLEVIKRKVEITTMISLVMICRGRDGFLFKPLVIFHAKEQTTLLCFMMALYIFLVVTMGKTDLEICTNVI